MDKRWVLKETGDQNTINKLSEELNINKTLATLLVQRDIHNFEQAKSFFRPQLSDLHDPFLMKNMDIAVERLETAIKENQKIMIYGDYDVDGTTAVALAYSFIKKYYKNLTYYIPDRYQEGYGISFKAIDFAAENDYKLIIALDCGIKANEKVDYANSKNIDFIICDHHLPGEFIPNAVAVLDPKQLDCPYPFKELSGCGVGFKFIQAFCIKNDIDFKEIHPYLDLVVVSIASDIVPITGENRILSYYGLALLSSQPRIGLNSIIKITGLENKHITINDIVFKIGPRINAAGRIESGNSSVELLVCENEIYAGEIASLINSYNTTRKDLDRNITLDALKMIEEDATQINKKTTVLYNEEWSKGVVGIVASRLTDHYYRPTIILTESNGLAVGSARSVEGFDLYKAVDACSSLLENFGGHMYAAGLSLRLENIPTFMEEFEKAVASQITDDQLIPQMEIDALIQLKEITPKFFNILRQFEPFGPGNMTPVFEAKEISDSGQGKLVGKNNEHLKLSLMEYGENGELISFPAIGYQQSQFFELTSKQKAFDICFSIEENEFRGETNLQIRIRDIKQVG